MPKKLPFDEMWRAEHYLRRAEKRGNCLCVGTGNYYPTWWRPGRKHERLSQLICRVFNGPRPQDSAVVMHSCDNKACIKPEHLSWGQQKQNLKDAFSKGRMKLPIVDHGARVRAGLHHWARLLPKDIVTIRARLANGEQLAPIAADFGITFQQVSKIKRGLRWGHL